MATPSVLTEQPATSTTDAAPQQQQSGSSVSKNKKKKEMRRSQATAATATASASTKNTPIDVSSSNAQVCAALFHPEAWFHRADANVALPLGEKRLHLFMLACNAQQSRVVTTVAMDYALLPLCIADSPLMALMLTGCGCAVCLQRASVATLNDRRHVFTAQELFYQYVCAAVYHICDRQDKTLKRILGNEDPSSSQPQKKRSAKLNAYERALRVAVGSVMEMSAQLLTHMQQQQQDDAKSASPLSIAAELFSGTVEPGAQTDALLARLNALCGRPDTADDPAAAWASVDYTLFLLNMAEMTLWTELIHRSALPAEDKKRLLLAAPLTQRTHVVPYMQAISEQHSLKRGVAEWTEQMQRVYGEARVASAERYARERRMHVPPEPLMRTLREHVAGYYAPADAYLAHLERLLCLARAPAMQQHRQEEDSASC